MKTMTKERSSTNTGSKDVTMEISKVGFFLLLTVAMAFGIISVSALIAGTIKAGGIIPLIGMMFGAL